MPIFFFLQIQLGDVKRTNNNTINGALNNSMGNSASVVEVSENNLLTFYEIYHQVPKSSHQQHEDAIVAEGILRLCADLDLAPDDFRILLFAWKCDAAQMGRITKQEFLQVFSFVHFLLYFEDLNSFI